MSNAISELPLAIFSTLAPIAAGAFIVLACVFLTTKLSLAQIKAIDKFTSVPVVLLFVGFIAAFFHLANPFNALGVFAGIGSSPLTNELLTGCVFMLAALVYWVCALTGKLDGKNTLSGNKPEQTATPRRVFCCVVAILALVFAWFIGKAYMMSTIVSWNSYFVPVQIVGFCLLGGTCTGTLVLSLAKSINVVRASNAKNILIAMAVLGLALGLGGLIAQVSATSGMQNAVANGAALANEVFVFVVASLILQAACALGVIFVVAKGINATKAPAVFGLCAAVVCVGIFTSRMVFYALQLSAGLTIAG